MMSKIDVICDQSQKSLKDVPLGILDMSNLQMLYMEGNSIEYLPMDLFQKLPRLTWLDVRNNKLKELPSGIANHRHLETLLLENNLLQILPNELGLVPRLMVLQLAGNPVCYPSKSILEKGTQMVTSFLRYEYEKDHGVILERPSEEALSEMNNPPPLLPQQTIKTKHKEKERKPDVRELLKQASANAKVTPKSPAITIKSLSEEKRKLSPPKDSPKISTDSGDSAYGDDLEHMNKTHRITKYCHKLSINSHYNSNKYLNMKKKRPNEDRVVDQHLKDVWMTKLKELLDDQEKLLQQERNLQALSSWRLQKKLEPPRKVHDAILEKPYDTDPEYDSMMQREDLYKEVDKMVRKKRNFSKCIDMQKLITEIVSQLKTLEATSEGQLENCSENELQRAENEIKRIIELHKKVTSLQNKNDTAY